MSCTEYRSQIQHSFTKTPGPSAKNLAISGISGAYAIPEPVMVAEMKMLAKGKLLTTLLATPSWNENCAVADFWDTFQQCFPLMAESLTVNFSYMLVASTPAEQEFTVSTAQVTQNSSIATVQKNMLYHRNVKVELGRQRIASRPVPVPSAVVEQELEDEHKRPRVRYNRNKNEQAAYHEDLYTTGQAFEERFAGAIKSKQQLLGDGKRKADMRIAVPRARTEMAANATALGKRVGSKAVLKSAKAHNAARSAGSTVLPTDLIDEMMKIISTRYWTKARVQAYLNLHCQQDGHDNNLRTAKAPATRSLQELLCDYWLELGLTLDAAKGVRAPEEPTEETAAPTAPAPVG
jgi:hypothetical protein